MRPQNKIIAANAIAGLALGFVVERIGFADYAELNQMFTLRDLRMFAAFAAAVVLIIVAFALLRVRREPGRIHAGVIPGGVLFGAGWAISGGCPSIPIIQVASGFVPALVTIAGIAVGIKLNSWANARYLRIDSGSCGQ